MNVTVLSAEEVKDKGDFKVFRVTCKDSDGVEIEADRASKWAPKQGDQGTIESGQYGPKFIPAAKAGGGGGNRGKSPEEIVAERASIEAQVALKGAIEWASVQLANGKEATSADIVKLTSVFAAAIRDAKA